MAFTPNQTQQPMNLHDTVPLDESSLSFLQQQEQKHDDDGISEEEEREERAGKGEGHLFDYLLIALFIALFFTLLQFSVPAPWNKLHLFGIFLCVALTLILSVRTVLLATERAYQRMDFQVHRDLDLLAVALVALEHKTQSALSTRHALLVEHLLEQDEALGSQYDAIAQRLATIQLSLNTATTAEAMNELRQEAPHAGRNGLTHHTAGKLNAVSINSTPPPPGTGTGTGDTDAVLSTAATGAGKGKRGRASRKDTSAPVLPGSSVRSGTSAGREFRADYDPADAETTGIEPPPLHNLE